MKYLKIFKVFVLTLFLFNLSLATEIYYVNIYDTVNKSKLKDLAQTIIQNKAKKLAEKYKINELKGKKQLTLDEQNRYIAFVNETNYLQSKISENITNLTAKLMKEFGKKYGYNVILAEVSVVYSSPKYNKTEEFIKFVNSKITKNKNKYIKEIGNIK